MSDRWSRCTTVEKPEVGRLHFHRHWWSPWRVSSMWYQPLGREVMYPVPGPLTDEVLTAGSFEQVMALLRSPKGQPAS